MTTTPPTRRIGLVQAARAVLGGLGSLLALLLTVPLVLLAVPFWTVRGLAAAGEALARRLEPEEASWGDLIRYEPEIGWKPRPGMDVHARAGALFHLTTDAEGWRGRLSLDDAELIVLGDSFAFGTGADDRDLFSRHVPGVSVKPVGANGYNLVQSYLWMKRLAPRLEGKMVAWLVFYENDLLENLLPNHRRYRMPFVRQAEGAEGWEIVTEHVSPEPWSFHGSRHYNVRLAEICSPTFLSRRVFSAAEFLIGRARETCREASADLAVVGIPSPDQVGPEGRRRLAEVAPEPAALDASLPDRRLGEICDDTGVPFLPLGEHLATSDYLPDDCHWTPGGHRKVGRLLGDLYREVRAARDEGAEEERLRGVQSTASTGSRG